MIAPHYTATGTVMFLFIRMLVTNESDWADEEVRAY